MIAEAALDLAPTESDPPPVRRTPIAVVSTGPVSARVRAVVDGLAASRPFDLESCLVASRTGYRGTLELTARWMRRPRAARPAVIVGIGDVGVTIARRTAKIFGGRSVAWIGRGAGETRADTLRVVDDVWAFDDAATRTVMAEGVRAYRALLAPSLKSVPFSEAVARPGRLVVAGAEALGPPTVEAIQRFGKTIEVAVIGHEDVALLAAWPEASVRFVDEEDAQARQATLTWASGVLVSDPEPLQALAVEALLLGRPLLVPAHRKPPGFGHELGIAFRQDRAESIADALAELRAATERGRFPPAVLRRLAEPFALEARLPEYVERLRAVAESPPRA